MKSLKELREESQGKTRALYHLNYWDGPISGVCLYDNQKCYFDTIDEVYEKSILSDSEWDDWCLYMKEKGQDIDEDDREETNWYRIYGVYETPPEAMEILDENHDLFSRNVGTHCDYDLNGCPGRGSNIPMRPDHPEDIGDLKPYKQHDNFYKAKKREAKIDKDNWKIICKFVGPF